MPSYMSLARRTGRPVEESVRSSHDAANEGLRPTIPGRKQWHLWLSDLLITQLSKQEAPQLLKAMTLWSMH